MNVDKNGGMVDCFAYPTGEFVRCRILKDWYCDIPKKRCRGCPFFKTRQQAEEDKKKYPVVDYKNRKE